MREKCGRVSSKEVRCWGPFQELNAFGFSRANSAPMRQGVGKPRERDIVQPLLICQRAFGIPSLSVQARTRIASGLVWGSDVGRLSIITASNGHRRFRSAMGSCYLLSLPMALTLAGAKQESLARAALSNCRDRTAQPRHLRRRCEELR